MRGWLVEMARAQDDDLSRMIACLNFSPDSLTALKYQKGNNQGESGKMHGALPQWGHAIVWFSSKCEH